LELIEKILLVSMAIIQSCLILSLLQAQTWTIKHKKITEVTVLSLFSSNGEEIASHSQTNVYESKVALSGGFQTVMPWATRLWSVATYHPIQSIWLGQS
jgi:hypothetical protein